MVIKITGEFTMLLLGLSLVTHYWFNILEIKQLIFFFLTGAFHGLN